ncbi:MAG TPA: hypothetical protein VKB69_10945 [Micromonosporaceae bacterium]|nr:hypothetical protein [Micromonosporaceae bacterium]
MDGVLEPDGSARDDAPVVTSDDAFDGQDSTDSTATAYAPAIGRARVPMARVEATPPPHSAPVDSLPVASLDAGASDTGLPVSSPDADVPGLPESFLDSRNAGVDVGPDLAIDVDDLSDELPVVQGAVPPPPPVTPAVGRARVPGRHERPAEPSAPGPAHQHIPVPRAAAPDDQESWFAPHRRDAGEPPAGLQAADPTALPRRSASDPADFAAMPWLKLAEKGHTPWSAFGTPASPPADALPAPAEGRSPQPDAAAADPRYPEPPAPADEAFSAERPAEPLPPVATVRAVARVPVPQPRIEPPPAEPPAPPADEVPAPAADAALPLAPDAEPPAFPAWNTPGADAAAWGPRPETDPDQPESRASDRRPTPSDLETPSWRPAPPQTQAPSWQPAPPDAEPESWRPAPWAEAEHPNGQPDSTDSGFPSWRPAPPETETPNWQPAPTGGEALSWQGTPPHPATPAWQAAQPDAETPSWLAAPPDPATPSWEAAPPDPATPSWQAPRPDPGTADWHPSPRPESGAEFDWRAALSRPATTEQPGWGSGRSHGDDPEHEAEAEAPGAPDPDPDRQPSGVDPDDPGTPTWTGGLDVDEPADPRPPAPWSAGGDQLPTHRSGRPEVDPFRQGDSFGQVARPDWPERTDDRGPDRLGDPDGPPGLPRNDSGDWRTPSRPGPDGGGRSDFLSWMRTEAPGRTDGSDRRRDGEPGGPYGYGSPLVASPPRAGEDLDRPIVTPRALVDEDLDRPMVVPRAVAPVIDRMDRFTLPGLGSRADAEARLAALDRAEAETDDHDADLGTVAPGRVVPAVPAGERETDADGTADPATDGRGPAAGEAQQPRRPAFGPATPASGTTNGTGRRGLLGLTDDLPSPDIGPDLDVSRFSGPHSRAAGQNGWPAWAAPRGDRRDGTLQPPADGRAAGGTRTAPGAAADRVPEGGEADEPRLPFDGGARARAAETHLMAPVDEDDNPDGPKTVALPNAHRSDLLPEEEAAVRYDTVDWRGHIRGSAAKRSSTLYRDERPDTPTTDGPAAVPEAADDGKLSLADRVGRIVLLVGGIILFIVLFLYGPQISQWWNS